MQKLSEIKSELSELATLLNQFKSEAVQLRILELIFDQRQTTGSQVPEPGASAHNSRTAKKVGSRKSGGKPSTQESPKKVASGNGAKSTLTNLVEGDFFNTYRTIGDIIKHCKVNLARNFRASDFSGKLARLVRSNELIRQKNNDSQYEYKKP